MNLVKKAAQDALMEAMRRGINAIHDETPDDAKFRERPKRNSGANPISFLKWRAHNAAGLGLRAAAR